MEELKVENIIIGKQFEESENYQNFIEIVNKNKIKVYVVEAGQKIKIEKDIWFDILWPTTEGILDNSINNNSLVMKFNYKNFSMLFTGDIEEIAEKKIIKKYKETNALKSTILKVSHHGSKTSSTEEFVKFVNPKISFIGVGKNNTFGHPSSGVLERLSRLWRNL